MIQPPGIKKKPFQVSSLCNFFSCSTQMSTKLIRLINVKMPTIVGILTFIGRKITSYESLKARKAFIFHYFIFYEKFKKIVLNSN